MSATKVTDHADVAVGRLLEQFKDKAFIEAVVRAFADEVQLLEDAFHELLDERTLAAAVGAQLDGIGRVIGLPRQGRDDETYRVWLRAHIRVNRSEGTGRDIIDVLSLLLTPTIEVDLQRHYPASIVVELNGEPLPAGQGPELAKLLQRTKAAGVRAILEYHETEPVFAFDGANGGSKFDGGWFLSTAIEGA